MNEQIIKLIVDRVGIDEATATKVVDTVMGFLKDNPDQLMGLIGGGEDGKVDMGDVTKKLGGLFGR
ncbi:MAG: hypothetical protein ACSLFM_14025 [Tepidiformaceae bacterium]